jgi:hypothetical protein
VESRRLLWRDVREEKVKLREKCAPRTLAQLVQ